MLQQNRDIDKITGYFDAHPMIAGCKCYLGSAAGAGFKYIQLQSKKEICNEKKLFNVQTYGEICEWYQKHKCADKKGKMLTPGEITKT